MKKLNTGMIITATLVNLYLTVSRIWAFSHLGVKRVKSLNTGKMAHTKSAAETA